MYRSLHPYSLMRFALYKVLKFMFIGEWVTLAPYSLSDIQYQRTLKARSQVFAVREMRFFD